MLAAPSRYYVQQELVAVHNAARQEHSTVRIGAFVAGEEAYDEAGGEWYVTWSPDEMGQVVHIPINISTGDTYTALKNMQSMADHCGAKVVPIESGVAIIGLATAVAEVVIQRWPHSGNGIHQPRRFITYRAHGTTEADIRFASPASGHDLMWMVATGGQIHLDRVAQALRNVLGEYPTTDMVCALHPETQAFEPMVQVSVPNHLRNLMIMGPAAEAFIQIGAHRCKVFPFTEIRQNGRHSAADDTHAARLMASAIGSSPNPPPRSTMFAQAGTIQVHAEGQRKGRHVPILIPLGGGTWRETACEAGATPAAYTTPSLGTQLDLSLRMAWIPRVR